jgi:hypothetical protein
MISSSLLTHFIVHVFSLYFYSRIFNDFGKQFEVIDTTGEEPLHGMIAAVSKVT